MSKVWSVSMLGQPAQGNTYENTWHYVTSAPPLLGDPTASDVLTQIDTKLSPKWANVLRSDETFLKVSVVQELASGDPTIPDSAELIKNTPGNRTAMGAVQPLEMTALGRVITHVKLRGASGHFFFTPPRASVLNSPPSVNLADAYGTAIQALAVELKNGISGGSWWSATPWTGKLVVYSRTRRNRGETNYWFDAKDVQVDTGWHWLRSRGR